MRTEHLRARIAYGIRLLATAASAVLLAVGAAHAASPAPGSADAARRIVVAIADKPDPAASAGSIPRGYAGLPDYAGSARSARDAARLASDYSLHEVSAWTIEPLHLRCMLMEVPDGSDRDALLARLQHDARVRLAQPLQEFRTLDMPPSSPPAPARADPALSYNDPYVGLQRGFSAIDAGAAQQRSRGEGVKVALIDTGIDGAHPDLAGRIDAQRDFVDTPADAADLDRHGTEVAGVIAAVANNRVGIVGIAPGTRLLSYRACWPAQANAGEARCNTYTLALALGAAITSRARLINLSLGGPHDPLLAELVAEAIARGAIVVGAVAPGGADGFPVDVPGVIAVRATGDAAAARPALAAPGEDILTLEPGGHYDYASGSSLATAHVTGAVALLLQLDGSLDGARAFALLERSRRDPSAPIDACVAVNELRPADHACGRASMGEPAHAAR